MKYISAYLLAKLGGKENPTVDDIKQIIESVVIEFESKKAEEIIEKLNGKDVNEVINEGKSKLTVISNDQSSQINQQQTNNKQNEEDKNKKEEEEETLDLGGGFDDLFG